ncbi:DUF192 domain-containing protein [candidate division WOR-3 bacterium]|nr:DUF192 domain-containing protein [candidate division WOR-3 bacterium]
MRKVRFKALKPIALGVVLLCGLAGCKGTSEDSYGTQPPASEVEHDFEKPDSARELPRIKMTLGGEEISLEVVRESKDIRQGLMFRDTLASNAGMLFVFPQDHLSPFWMKNTYVPLSIAFVSKDSIIVGVISRMEPLDTVTKHMPGLPYRFAIEMNAGWFEAHGVKVGARIKIPALP